MGIYPAGLWRHFRCNLVRSTRLAERDIKRVLAYSSVENVGIILMGIGVGMVGLAADLPVLAVLGFLAALYHVLNHAFFKGLLFLGAGSVIDRVGTRDLNHMGGLARRMPLTALVFLIGAMSVSAIPPFNGFVSEWFTYQSLFSAAQMPILLMRVFAPLLAVVLALAGAFAVMVYIKAYGGAFTGPARSQAAAEASEAPRGALASMVYLALGCLYPWNRSAADCTLDCECICQLRPCTACGGIEWLAGLSRENGASGSISSARGAFITWTSDRAMGVGGGIRRAARRAAQ